MGFIDLPWIPLHALACRQVWELLWGDALSARTEQGFHLKHTRAPRVQCQTLSGLTWGLKAPGHVCAACEGRQPLHALQRCARNVGEQETASFLPGLLQTRGPEPPLVTVVSHICSPLLGRERDMHESLWLWSLVVEGLYLTFLWAAGTPHLLLVLQGLQSQLRVRRKRVPRLYSAYVPGALCTHPLPPCRVCSSPWAGPHHAAASEVSSAQGCPLAPPEPLYQAEQLEQSADLTRLRSAGQADKPMAVCEAQHQERQPSFPEERRLCAGHQPPLQTPPCLGTVVGTALPPLLASQTWAGGEVALTALEVAGGPCCWWLSAAWGWCRTSTVFSSLILTM